MEAPSSTQPGNQAIQFPTLEILNPTEPHTFINPAKRINDGPDVKAFLKSKAYRDIGTFVLQLNRAMCPRKVTDQDGNEVIKTFQIGSESETQPAEPARKLQQMLSKINSFIDEAPPDPGPRRFGNVSFRKWYKLLDERVQSLLDEYMPEPVLKYGSTSKHTEATAADELKAYLLGSFGSQQRLDYGTGHELSFLAFLGCLWKLGAFQDGNPNGDTERNLVLGVFEPYLRVVRRLILTYNLEPAGSHGVWGLDDHSFLPYVFGSAQLTRAIKEDEPMPLEGSLFRVPKPALVAKSDHVEEERKRNMYFSAIGFINDVKTGPFWEHSPILFDISGVRDGWGKINKGMIKMFNAEVLSKFPVVQHFTFGSLFSWDQDPGAAEPQNSIHLANQPRASQGTMPAPGGAAGTAAPWAQATSMPPSGPGVPYSTAPWISGQSSMRPPPPTRPTGTQMPPIRSWAKGNNR
ncbi:serine/threonine-protein phosphatase 2A activator 1 [Pseudomassariella vexata]|uniref:Serine/threonine-protein phosphatase 2A activator n=1 Tax=Pseudomassariella vexata TaxID=1141098 RepID=A0A1Y2DTI1_9PEZI|nr:serine/threonine-protein phosphatase 2A activator 1 [Pseudomassariella vexata]ORY62583.1 serine/threonine-protein phosphatase 2A activator 1 [Pseudomassariella vexata]